MTNRELIELWYHEMWNRWNKEVIPEIVDEKITFRGSLGKVNSGHGELSDYIDLIRNAFPDFHNSIELILSEEDKAFAKLTYTGTHRGELFGIAPTNRSIEYAGSALFSFRDGKIVDVWVLGDLHGLLQQLKHSIA